MVQNSSNKELSTEVESRKSKNTPIQSLRMGALLPIIGRVFVLQGGYIDKSPDFNNKDKTNVSAIHEVVVTSKNAKLPLGTRLQVKIKGGELLEVEEDSTGFLLGTIRIVVAFDNLSHWTFNGKEGLNAENIRILGITPEEAMKL